MTEDMIKKIKEQLNEVYGAKAVIMPKPPEIVYLCDRDGCAVCSSDCNHTSDIAHAINFEQVAPGKYAEKDTSQKKHEL
jgi:MinD superfamily P-loop ATPase